LLALVESGIARRRRCRFSFGPWGKTGWALLRLELPAGVRPGAAARCAARAGEALAAAGAGTLCFRNDFPCRRAFLDAGFCEADCGALLSAKAGEILAVSARGADSAYFCARPMDGNAIRAARVLCRRFRRLTADVEDGEWERLFAAALRCGLAPMRPCASGEAQAGAAVFFSPPRTKTFLSPGCRVLFPSGARPPGVFGGSEIPDVRFSLPERLRPVFPAGYPAGALLSALVEESLADPGEIAVLGPET